MPIGKLTDEAGRLAALNRYSVLDTGPEQSFEKITALVKSVLQVPICAVSLIDKDRQWFKAIQGADLKETSRDISFCDHTIRDREVLLVPDATIDERFADNPLVTGEHHIRSYAGVPLETPDGFNLGALCVIDVERRKFSEEQVALLKQFASVVVRELELRSGTMRDPLSGGLTRQGFDDAMQICVAAFQDQGSQCSLLLIDMDNFAIFNDEFGRAGGDKVLRGVAACIQTTLRDTDVIGRLAGDTFAIMLPGATAYEAVACAERLRNKVAQLAFTGVPPRRVTVSCGVASLQRGDSRDVWLAQAKGALFAAKRRGRNLSMNADRLY